MAKCITDTVNLTSVADAIRIKGGTSDPLVYPSGFISAIQAMQTGIIPKLVVTTRPGAAVTATTVEGFKIVKGTADTNGTCILELPKAGTWNVTALANGASNKQRIVIGTQSMLLPLYHDTFADNTWAEIIEACQTGVIPDSWAVGDNKPMTIDGTVYQVDIIGKNHDIYADGSGTAPLTFQLHDCYADIQQMNSSNTNSGGWTSCIMRQTHLPAVLLKMPEEVQNGIRKVNKLTADGSAINTTTDKLFVLSEVELVGSTDYSAEGEGTQYDYYKAGNSKVKKQNGSAAHWWERSPIASDSTSFCLVYSYGNAGANGAGIADGVAFGFCF